MRRHKTQNFNVVGSEVLKLLSAPDPAPSVAAMRAAGVLAAVLPGADDRTLPLLVHLEQSANLSADAMRRLACLGGDDPAPLLRLSKAQTKRLHVLRDGMESTASVAEFGNRCGVDMALDIAVLRDAMLETPFDPSARRLAEIGAQAEFPICARDLMPAYCGPALGARLDELKKRWIASGFKLTRDELLK
jgi:poly(A) polymerase